ncbi:Hypothetical protein PHPALM_21182 [Globisporangium polare]
MLSVATAAEDDNKEGDNTVAIALGGAATGFMAVVLVAVALRKTHKSIDCDKDTTIAKGTEDQEEHFESF